MCGRYERRGDKQKIAVGGDVPITTTNITGPDNAYKAVCPNLTCGNLHVGTVVTGVPPNRRRRIRINPFSLEGLNDLSEMRAVHPNDNHACNLSLAQFCVLHAEMHDMLKIVEGSHGNRSSQTRVDCLG
jgi:hypothetical protein